MSLPVAHIPEVLKSPLEAGWQRLLDSAGEYRTWFEDCAADPQRGPQLARMFACSPAALDLCRRDPAALPELDSAHPLGAAVPTGYWQSSAAAIDCADGKTLNAALRRLRNRAWLRIVWRDLNRLASTEQTIHDLSLLADACLRCALDFHHAQLVERYGEPRDADGNPQRLVVLAMGKLGGFELNLSSDIDLIFTFPEPGKTDGEQCIDNGEFFIKLGRKLIAALDTQDANGFVFRVDMRLRPWGESGPLAISFDAIEGYYEQHGRDWERYAMIKARACAGDIAAGESLLDRLRPFVYRRYLDFAVLESLRDMKSMIRAEVRRRQLDDNIKLGAGGIREIEFVAQCLQLIRGGQLPVLQCRSLGATLDHLRDLELLETDEALTLWQAYCYLRDVEHAIQGYEDAQTQELPVAAAPRAALALALGEDSFAACVARLQTHRESVAALFNELIEPARSEQQRDSLQPWRIALQDSEVDELTASLDEAGMPDAAAVGAPIGELLSGKVVQSLPGSSRERLFNFLPLLLQRLAQQNEPAQTLQRLLPMIEAVLRRSTYLVLLSENESALDNLVALVAESPWIARSLSEHPLLLDEMLDARRLYEAPDRDELLDELNQRLLRIVLEDDESFMDALRYFKLTHTLRIAAAELSGRSPLMVASDHLTWLAEVILEAALGRAWQQLLDRYGVPAGVDSNKGEIPFLIVGYGKLGGIELSYGSDLDLVFVHNLDASASTEPSSEEARSVDNGTFLARLGQRLIHILGARTRHGELYEADMRLRPSGNSGLLVTSMTALRDYQHNNAWTWEHQALVRARPVAGNVRLAEDFIALREEVLCQSRDVAALRSDVVEMRDKMRAQLAPARDDETFDFKHSEGAIVDIEFMVQYAVLAGSHQYPSLARYTDNIRILESLGACGLWSTEQAEALADAYRHYRSESHRLNLRELPAVAMAGDHARFRDVVRDQWQRVMHGDSE